jgi:hypothetical protein
MRRLACCTAIAALLALVPATADAAATRAQRVAAADTFAKRTLSFERKRVAAEKRARAALTARRTAAQACLPAFKDAPGIRREDLRTMYFEYLSGGLWSVDAPLVRSWIVDLRASGRIDRFVTLARAADALRRQYNVAAIFYKAYPDICTTVTNWQHSGWTDEARKTALAGITGKLDDPPRKGDPRVLDQAIAALRNTARNGKAAADILEVGVDEPDARVHFHTSCDAVGALLFPEEYPGCTP